MRRELVFGIYLVLVAFSVLCMGLILLLLAKQLHDGGYLHLWK